MGNTTVISHTQNLLDGLQEIINKKRKKTGLDKPISVGFLSHSFHQNATDDATNEPITNAQLAYMLNYGYTFSENGYTIIVPSRPFLQKTIDNIKNMKFNGEITAKLLAKNLKGLFIHHLTSGAYQQNSPHTIKNKGFNYPLFETGALSRSVEYKIGKI